MLLPVSDRIRPGSRRQDEDKGLRARNCEQGTAGLDRAIQTKKLVKSRQSLVRVANLLISPWSGVQIPPPPPFGTPVMTWEFGVSPARGWRRSGPLTATITARAAATVPGLRLVESPLPALEPLERMADAEAPLVPSGANQPTACQDGHQVTRQSGARGAF